MASGNRKYFRHGFLPQLMAFEACMRHGSVTRAAEELCLAQPTVSCMLRKLAEAAGGRIAQVSARRMVPTERGRRLLVLAQDMAAACERHEAAEPSAAGYDRAASPRAATPWPSISP